MPLGIRWEHLKTRMADQLDLVSSRFQESYRVLEQKLADRTRELEAVSAIASVLSQSLDLDEVLDGALDKTLVLMDVEAGGIYLLDEEVGRLNIAAQRGFDPDLLAEIDDLALGEGFSGRVAQSGEAMVVRNVPADERLSRMAMRDQAFDSLVSVPLCSKRQVMGTLFVMSCGVREFGEQDVAMLVSIGLQIGMAIESARLFHAVQRQAEQSRVIAEVGQRITSILDIDQVLVQIVRLIRKTFEYDHVAIALIEGDEAVYQVGAGDLWDDPTFDFEPSRLKVGAEGITGWVASSGEPILAPDVRQEPHYVWMRGSTTRSELAVPIKARGEVIGVLDAQSERLNAFDETDLSVLQSLAHQAGIAIENARLFDAEQRRAEQFRVVSKIGSHITSILNIDELLEEIVRVIRDTFGYHLVGISLVEGDELVVRAGAGPVFEDAEFHPPLLKLGGNGITGWVATEGKPLLVPDVSQDPRYHNLSEAAEIKSELAVPIKTKSAVIGVLNVESDRLDDFDESDLAMLQALAHQAAIVIENVNLYERAQQLGVMEERQRLARELHDAVTQTLFSASLIAEALPDLWQSDPEEGWQLLGELRQLNRGALAEMRTLLLELRPTALMDASLVDLLPQLGEAVAGRIGVPVKVSVEGACTFPSDVHVALYRIAQEALNNVVKHASASEVVVCLECAPYSDGATSLDGVDRKRQIKVELQVRDDGRGFDPDRVPPDHLGLGIIRERAQDIGAELEIDAGPGRGTTVRVLWKGEE